MALIYSILVLCFSQARRERSEIFLGAGDVGRLPGILESGPEWSTSLYRTARRRHAFSQHQVLNICQLARVVWWLADGLANLAAKIWKELRQIMSNVSVIVRHNTERFSFINPNKCTRYIEQCDLLTLWHFGAVAPFLGSSHQVP